MCGIAGIISFREDAQELHRIDEATDCLAKRGPDDRGVFTDKNVALGHRRLSIIDTSHGAVQPMSDATGRYQIIFNGEFFNYAGYRNLLKEEGVSFRTESDTEVLLALYIKHGSSFLQFVNGFFALAIYDSKEKTVFIARDRMGVKPLLYYKNSDVLFFASEMKALLAMGIPRSLNKQALYQYLQLNYIPPSESMITGVEKLSPGSFLFINLTEQSIKEEKYYHLPEPKEYKKLNYNNAVQHFHHLLDEAVQRRLVSDVPLGAFLSGGLDSSVIVALAARHVKSFNTFSIGFKDDAHFDETSFASLVADKFKTNHHVFKLQSDDMLQCITDVLDYIDEPFADSSALNVYILSRETRKHVTVALSGDGADEMFGGYRKHRAEWIIRNRKVYSAMISSASTVLSGREGSRHSKKGNRYRQLHRFAEGYKLSRGDRYWQWCSITGSHKAASLIKDFKHAADEVKSAITSSITSDFNSVLRADMNLVLTGDMLVKVDQMSMANSLEVRNPFLDYEVVNYAFSLPSDYKINSKEQKKIVRDAFRNELPEELFTRSKQGFEIPLLRWLKTSLHYLIDELLDDELVINQGVFNVSEVRTLKEQLHSDHPGDAAARIWALIVFQYWYKKYFLVNNPGS